MIFPTLPRLKTSIRLIYLNIAIIGLLPRRFGVYIVVQKINNAFSPLPRSCPILPFERVADI